MTFWEVKGKSRFSWTKYHDVPGKIGRLLHGIYEAFGRGVGGMVDRLRKRAASATLMLTLVPRARPLRENIPDRSSAHGLASDESVLSLGPGLNV